ncbi:cupin domain-containing protein [Streptomyces sp. NPDC056462]|uniref:cupin domain-containing protein n=1 Tax=Streptomyces sp. NPDC056462 TaxID=3345826 RepID=UPI0036BECA31
MLTTNVLKAGEGEIITLPGASIIIKDRLPGCMDDCVVVEFTAEPGFRGPGPHIHADRAEYIWVLDGEFEWTVNEESFRISAGEYIKIPEGAVHNFSNVSSQQSRWFGLCPASEAGLYSH